MNYSGSYQVAGVATAPKAPTFVTKVPHDVVLTETESRIFIKNIKSGVTLAQFKNSMERYGAVQVYIYEHGNNNSGWAWVGFESKEAAMQAVEDARRMEAERKVSREISGDMLSNERKDSKEEEDPEQNLMYDDQANSDMNLSNQYVDDRDRDQEQDLQEQERREEMEPQEDDNME